MNTEQNVGTQCQEAADTLVSDGGFVVLARVLCKLVDLSVTLNEDSPVGGYVWVFDADITSYISENKPIPTQLRKLNPRKIAAGETRNWCPRTKWTPFNTAMSVAISSTSDVFTLAPTATFSAFRHVIYR